MLLSDVPEIQGRSAAGVSITNNGHVAPTATIVAPPASSWRIVPSHRRFDASTHPSAIPGTTSNATPIFVSNPNPMHTPLNTSQRVRPFSNPLTADHTAATEHRASSSSGLL